MTNPFSRGHTPGEEKEEKAILSLVGACLSKEAGEVTSGLPFSPSKNEGGKF